MTTTVYTDGACLGNPGPGGWAWAVPGGAFASGAAAETTNQRMEVTAVLEALRALPGQVHVVSDSTYVVNCFRDRWWEGWLRRGWTNSKKEPVANRDLWEPLIDLYRSRSDEIRFSWVKGHADDPANDLVDRLAVEAAQTQTGRHGKRPPEEVGAPDVPGGPDDRDPRLPSGQLILVTGHRPTELGGYGENPLTQQIRERLTEILRAKKELHPDATVLTGLNLGAEQLGAEAARDAGVPYVAVLAFPDPQSVWPESSKKTFDVLTHSALRTIVLQRQKPATKQDFGAAMRRRDGWLSSQADEAIVVWNGTEPNLGRYVRALEDALDDAVWIVHPEG